MGIKFKTFGSWRKTQRMMQRLSSMSDIDGILNRYGKLGVQYLREATPKRTGTTAEAWSYEIDRSKRGRVALVFKNSNTVKGVNIAVILQYGHGTRNGGYVQGIDYINPASQRVFQQMANELWAEVKST